MKTIEQVEADVKALLAKIEKDHKAGSVLPDPRKVLEQVLELIKSEPVKPLVLAFHSKSTPVKLTPVFRSSTEME